MTEHKHVCRRSRGHRIIAGVCGGAAEQLGFPAWLVRTLCIVGVVVGFGSLAVVYVILWLLIPEAD